MSARKARSVARWEIQSPPCWGAFPVAANPVSEVRRAIREVAARLTTDAEGAARCEQLLLVAQPGYVGRGLAGAAIWVPDPIAEVPLGVLLVEALETRGATADDLAAQAGRAPTPPGTTVLSRSVQQVDLAAGPAVAVTEAGHDLGQPTELTVRWVLPPDCDTAFSLLFSTGALHLQEEFLEQAARVAASLMVEVA